MNTPQAPQEAPAFGSGEQQPAAPALWPAIVFGFIGSFVQADKAKRLMLPTRRYHMWAAISTAAGLVLVLVFSLLVFVALVMMTNVGTTGSEVVSEPIAQAPAEDAAAPAPGPVELTFHPVLGTGDPADVVEVADTTAESTVLDEGGQPILIGPAALTGVDVGSASAGADQQTGRQRFVSVEFQNDGGRKWEVLTGAAACNAPATPQRRVAILLDGRVLSSPQVAEDVQCNVGISGGTTQITGSFTEEEAEQLARRINAAE